MTIAEAIEQIRLTVQSYNQHRKFSITAKDRDALVILLKAVEGLK